MQRKFFIAAIGLLLSVSTFAQINTSGIKFEERTSWKEVLKKAKAENKLIFMDAYTTWCGPCKMLQARVFPDRQLGDYFNKNFVNAAIDMESDEGLRLSSIYEVRGYPTLFFIDPSNGKVVKSILGYTEIDQLLDTGKRMASKKKS